MAIHFRGAFDAIQGRILLLAEQDAEFRRDLHILAESLLNSTSPAERQQEDKAQVPLILQKATASTESELIEQRCRIKAEACSWAAQRIRLRQEGADFRTEIAPSDREILNKANAAQDCSLWMCRSSAPAPLNVSLYEVVGQCFDVLAEIVALALIVISELGDERHLLEETLYLLAEAQSALRAAIQQIDGPTDHDQISAYIWVKETASGQGIFIERFMFADDQADPANAADLLVRVQDLDIRVQEALKQRRSRRKLLGKLRYVLGLLAESAEEAQLAHWQTAAATLDQLMELGVPPSNIEIRHIVLPHIDDAPEFPDAPQGYGLVLREIRRFQDGRSASCEPRSEEAGSPDIERAARLLHGKSVVLIGGDSRPTHKEALEQALGISELVWVDTKPGQSFTTFQRFVARPQVAVVLLAIRWASHAYKDVRQYCDRYQKPLVWLPGGISPAQVAARIIGQAGHRLRQRNDQDAA